MVRTLVIGAVALIAAGCATGPADEPAATAAVQDDIIARHVAAVGGEDAIEAVEAIEVRLQIQEPGFAVTGHYRARRDGRMRIDIYAGDERVFSEGFDGEAGWQLTQDAEEGVDMSPEGEAAVRRGVIGNLYGVHEREQFGATVTSGEIVIDEATYPTISIVYADGFEALLILDPETYLVARTRSDAALHPDIDPTERRLETYYADMREVDGVMRSFLQQTNDMETGAPTQITIIENVISNPEIDDAIFERP